MQIVVDELREVSEKYGDERRTEILAEEGEFRIEDLIAEEDMAITVSNTGYIKRTAITNYRNQRRGGKGRIGMRTREEDFVSHLFVASTHAYIMIFSDRGRAYWLKVHEIPDVGPDGRGKAIANLVSMEEGERIAALLAVKEFEDDKFIVMGTRRGVVKKTELTAFSNPRAGGIIAMGVEEGDAVIAVQVSDGNGEIFIGTRNGMSIRFRESDVRSMGRTACGVRGIALARRRRGGGDGGAAPGRDDPVGHRAGLRQAHRAGRVPRPVARRHRHHQHPDAATATARSSACLQVQRRRRADADHAAGQDPADGVERHPHHRPRDAGRPADRHRRRRSRRVDRAARGKGRRDQDRRRTARRKHETAEAKAETTGECSTPLPVSRTWRAASSARPR